MSAVTSRTAGESSDFPGDPGTLLFENERVRVWELVMRPGEICNWHRHDHDHLLVVFEGCRVHGVKADGSEVERDIPDGKVLFMPASPLVEIARNVSPDKTLRELIIDLKDPSAATTAVGLFDFFRAGTATTSRPGVLHPPEKGAL